MNLLEAYEHVEPQAIATQLAILEVVTYPNAIGTGLKQTREGAGKLANKAWRLFSNSDLIQVKPADSLTHQVVERSQQCSQLDTAVLTRKVFIELGTRLECSAADLETLSTRVIREAAAGLNIDGDLLLGQQAEQVARKYWDACLDGIKKQLDKQSPNEAVRMEQAISDRLASMTSAERLELQKTLNLTDLSGRAVRSAFLQTGGPLAGIAAVNMAGFGAYIALSVIVHAIFTTMLGITLPFAFYTGASSLLSLLTGPFGIALAVAAGLAGYAVGHRKLNRSQYAMIVWACAIHYGRDLFSPTNLLPSVSPFCLPGRGSDGSSVDFAISSEDHAQSDHELCARAAEKDSARSSQDFVSNELRSHSKELAQLRELLRKAEQELRSARLKTDEASSALGRKAIEIGRFESEISRLSSEVAFSAEKVRTAESRAQEVQARLHAAEEKYEAKVKSRRAELERLWKVHFPNFTFASKALRWVAEKTFNERLEVERALIELRDAGDPVSISRGKMHGTDQHHTGFVLAHGVPARIYYRIKNRSVEITQILKKNEAASFSATA